MTGTSTAENELIRGYNLINSATNYTKVGCKKKILHSADEYNNILQNLADEYLSILTEYTSRYPTYNMELYEEDLFNGKPTKFFTDLVDTVSKDKKKYLDASGVEKEMKSVLDAVPGGSAAISKKQKDDLNAYHRKYVIGSIRKLRHDKWELQDLNDKYIKNKNIAQTKFSEMLGADRNGILVNMEDIETRLLDVQHELFTIKHQIETDIESMQDCILTVSKDIDSLQVKNSKLERKINSLQGRKAGAVGQVYDSQLLYNQYYLGNIIISIIVIVLLYKYLALYITDITGKVDTKFIPISYTKDTDSG